MIRKLGKKDYYDLKFYKLILLLNTLSKNIEFILIKRILVIAELY